MFFLKLQRRHALDYESDICVRIMRWASRDGGRWCFNGKTSRLWPPHLSHLHNICHQTIPTERTFLSPLTSHFLSHPILIIPSKKKTMLLFVAMPAALALARHSLQSNSACRPQRPLHHARRAHILMNNNNTSGLPSNSNSDDHSNQQDFDVLRKRIAKLDNNNDPSTSVSELQMNENEGLELLDIDKLNPSVSSVWVILFRNANDGTEGIYSLTVDSQNIVLAFEEKLDAHRYVISLEAQKFPQSQIVHMSVHNLNEFCTQGGIKLGFVPNGRIILPPEQSVIDDLDKWSGNNSANSTSRNSGLTQDDIDTMRKRLDSLFGQWLTCLIVPICTTITITLLLLFYYDNNFL